MKELAEIRLNDNRILLKDNRVMSPILPKLASELDRDVVVQGECVIEGAVFARTLEIEQGPCRARGPVFAHSEVHVNSDARGTVFFEKAVGAAGGIVSLASGCGLHFLSDLTAKEVRLRNAYVSGSIFADSVVLEDCVVLGGVFGANTIEMSNCIVGTFNAPAVRLAKTIYLLFPSAFSVEMVSCLPGTQMYNLTLADLGSLMRGVDPQPSTGKIEMDLAADELKAVLTGDGTQQIVRTYSVAGKVLAADLVDLDKLQNHFLISCASLNSQLLRTYDLGLDRSGKPVELTPERVAAFFFAILDGKLQVPDLSGEFDLRSIVRGETPVARPAETSEIREEAAPESVPEAPAKAASPVAEPTPVLVEASADAVQTGLCRFCQKPLEPGEAFCGFCGKSQA